MDTPPPSRDRPFDPAVLREAERLAGSYSVEVRRSDDDGRYYGHGVEYPYLLGDGATVAEARTESRAALVSAVATDLERGETPPPRAG